MDVDWMFAVASHVLGFELCKLSIRLCNYPNWGIISTDCLYRPITPRQCVSMGVGETARSSFGQIARVKPKKA